MSDLSIPAIDSAVLNMSGAESDLRWAKAKWVKEEWIDCILWINQAIAQLESARAKIQAHQQQETNAPTPNPHV